jgi:hypothetical protein
MTRLTPSTNPVFGFADGDESSGGDELATIHGGLLHRPVYPLRMERRAFLGFTASLGVPLPHAEVAPIRRLTTGIAALDELLGGGYPCGHFTLLDGFCLGSLRLCRPYVLGPRLAGLSLASDPTNWHWVPTRTEVEDEIAAAIKADAPLICWVSKDSRFEEYLGWVKDAPVPVLLEAWIARDPETREVLHRYSAVELLVEKYLKRPGAVQYYIRVVADRIQGRMGAPYNFEQRPPDPKDGTTCEFDPDRRLFDRLRPLPPILTR